MLDQIKIILVETTHSGNIGSVARAMKTMGLSKLCLVNPQQQIDEQAVALSAGASDLLENVEIVNTIDEAIAESNLIVGTSARLRHLQQTLRNPREIAQIAQQHTANGSNVAIIFGRERSGLTNEELIKCHYHLNIPANPHYSSLNLAMAVQIVTYELNMSAVQQNKIAVQSVDNQIENKEDSLANGADLNHLFVHTETVYSELGFIRSPQIMDKIKILYNRAQLQKSEVNILRGMLTAVERKIIN